MSGDEQKKVIFTTISMTGGGTERVIATLANYLVGDGYSVSIIMIAGDEIAYPLDERIEIFSIGKKSGGSLYNRIKRTYRLRREITRRRDCSVIAMGSVCGIFTAVATMLLSDVRLNVSERNVPDRINRHPYSTSLKIIRNLLYSIADNVILQSEYSRGYFPTKIGNKAVVLPNPLLDSIIEPFRGSVSNRIVSAGRLIEDKNYSLLIAGFDDFADIYDDYSLTIYGDGPLKEELERQILECKHSDRIVLYPFSKMIHEDIKDAYLYVSTSNSEGISNMILEVLALGIPVIATDCPIGGTAMMVKNEINGLLIPVGDREALVASMVRIVGDSGLREQMAINAKMAREEFSTEKVCEKWISTLKL